VLLAAAWELRAESQSAHLATRFRTPYGLACALPVVVVRSHCALVQVKRSADEEKATSEVRREVSHPCPLLYLTKLIVRIARVGG
jgi:hypothetical protein